MQPETLAIFIATNHNGGEFAQAVFGDEQWRERCEAMCDDPVGCGVTR